MQQEEIPFVITIINVLNAVTITVFSPFISIVIIFHASVGLSILISTLIIVLTITVLSLFISTVNTVFIITILSIIISTITIILTVTILSVKTLLLSLLNGAQHTLDASTILCMLAHRRIQSLHLPHGMKCLARGGPFLLISKLIIEDLYDAKHVNFYVFIAGEGGYHKLLQSCAQQINATSSE